MRDFSGTTKIHDFFNLNWFLKRGEGGGVIEARIIVYIFLNKNVCFDVFSLVNQHQQQKYCHVQNRCFRNRDTVVGIFEMHTDSQIHMSF